MVEYGKIVEVDLKNGKRDADGNIIPTERDVDDAWVIENVRYVEISAEKTTIKADGKESTVVTFKLQTGELVSKPTRKDVIDDLIIAFYVEGARYTLPLLMGEGEVEFDAVYAGKYAITVEDFSHNEFAIEATDAEDQAGEAASSGETGTAVQNKGRGDTGAAGVDGVQSPVDGAKG